MARVDIISYSEKFSDHFTNLNLAWLNKYFVVEPIDREMLFDPKTYILDKGGYIFFAIVDEEVAGTFALIPINYNTYELSKMAVDEALQGNNIGNAMMSFCIEEAKRLSIKKLILYSNTRLKQAIHLYKKYGFKEVPLDDTEYERANIKMEIDVNEQQQ